MDKAKTRESDFMTVGELAAKAGVTVRTIQYYDQKGLMTPSARGSRNLRLYTSQDQDCLCRILCYKFLGLTLDEIRERLEEEDGADTAQQIGEELRKRISREEREISERMKRYALMKDLQSYTECHSVKTWGSYAELIDYLQEKWSLIWEVNRAYEDNRQPSWDTDAGKKLMGYYRLIVETIRLMREGVSAQSAEAMNIIAQYREMRAEDSVSDSKETRFEKEALFHIDPLIMTMDITDFAGMWNEIKSFLREAGENYQKTMTKK